jgi:hypothetical protein
MNTISFFLSHLRLLFPLLLPLSLYSSIAILLIRLEPISSGGGGGSMTRTACSAKKSKKMNTHAQREKGIALSLPLFLMPTSIVTSKPKLSDVHSRLPPPQLKKKREMEREGEGKPQQVRSKNANAHQRSSTCSAYCDAVLPQCHTEPCCIQRRKKGKGKQQEENGLPYAQLQKKEGRTLRGAEPPPPHMHTNSDEARCIFFFSLFCSEANAGCVHRYACVGGGGRGGLRCFPFPQTHGDEEEGGRYMKEEKQKEKKIQGRERGRCRAADDAVRGAGRGNNN